MFIFHEKMYLCVQVCFGGVLFMCCWYGWCVHKVNKSNILVSCSIAMLFPQLRVSLTLELGR